MEELFYMNYFQIKIPGTRSDQNPDLRPASTKPDDCLCLDFQRGTLCYVGAGMNTGTVQSIKWFTEGQSLLLSAPRPPPLPGSMLDRRHTEILRKRGNFLTGEGGGAKGVDVEPTTGKLMASINHLVLSGSDLYWLKIMTLVCRSLAA
jgi:hypothetical protein